MKAKWPILVGGMAVVISLVLLLATGFGRDPKAVPDMLTGAEAPLFQMVDLEGKAWTLDELQGRPVVLNFWSTWCLPCKAEHPLLLQAARAYPDVVFLGVIYSDEPPAVRRYLEVKGGAYPHLLDPGGRMALDYGVTGVPETFFIDRSGTIVFKYAAALSPNLLQQQLERIRQVVN